MSAAKPNPMLNFATPAPAQEPAKRIEPKAAKPVPAASPGPESRGRGRPRLARSEDQQTTTIRLSADDHTAVRMLALRDKVPMNELIITALREYCGRRGVKLTD